MLDRRLLSPWSFAILGLRRRRGRHWTLATAAHMRHSCRKMPSSADAAGFVQPSIAARSGGRAASRPCARNQPAVRGPGYLAGRVFIRGPQPAVRGSEPPAGRVRRSRGIEPAVRTPRRRAGRAVRPSQKGCSRRVSVPQPRPCYDRPICVARARSDRPICSPQLPPAPAYSQAVPSSGSLSMVTPLPRCLAGDMLDACDCREGRGLAGG